MVGEPLSPPPPRRLCFFGWGNGCVPSPPAPPPLTPIGVGGGRAVADLCREAERIRQLVAHCLRLGVVLAVHAHMADLKAEDRRPRCLAQLRDLFQSCARQCPPSCTPSCRQWHEQTARRCTRRSFFLIHTARGHKADRAKRRAERLHGRKPAIHPPPGRT